MAEKPQRITLAGAMAEVFYWLGKAFYHGYVMCIRGYDHFSGTDEYDRMRRAQARYFSDRQDERVRHLEERADGMAKFRELLGEDTPPPTRE